MASFNELIDVETPVVVDFYADWCAPCKMMPPILQEVKNTKGDGVRIVKINVDKNQRLASQYGIRSIPTLIVFKNGKEYWRKSGVAQASEIIAALPA